MKITKQDVLSYVVPAIIGIIIGLCLVKCTSKPVDNIKIERDTVVVVDTAYYDRPAPKDSVRTKWVTRWLPASPDTIDHFIGANNMDHFADTSKMIAVEVPITSKHYGSKDYDAWVSGYEPSLDSIKVYKETQYITETITRTVKDKGKHFFLDVGAGCEYQFNTKTAVPFAELGARVKIGRVGIGAYGGYAHDVKENKASPMVKAKVTYDILSF